MLGNRNEITELSHTNNLDLGDLEIIDPKSYSEIDDMVEAVQRRKGKINHQDARELCLNNHNYFGTMLVYLNKAKGLVSGAANSTADTVRPALQIIKMKPSFNLVSGIFLMLKEKERLLFADCAININPNSTELADIAYCSSLSAKSFGIGT